MSITGHPRQAAFGLQLWKLKRLASLSSDEGPLSVSLGRKRFLHPTRTLGRLGSCRLVQTPPPKCPPLPKATVRTKTHPEALEQCIRACPTPSLKEALVAERWSSGTASLGNWRKRRPTQGKVGEFLNTSGQNLLLVGVHVLACLMGHKEERACRREMWVVWRRAPLHRGGVPPGQMTLETPGHGRRGALSL